MLRPDRGSCERSGSSKRNRTCRGAGQKSRWPPGSTESKAEGLKVAGTSPGFNS